MLHIPRTKVFFKIFGSEKKVGQTRQHCSLSFCLPNTMKKVSTVTVNIQC